MRAYKLLINEDHPLILKNEVKPESEILQTNKLKKDIVKIKYITTLINKNIKKEKLKIIEEIKNKNFDVVLMDLQMPGMDGYETARAIRTMEGSYFKNIKIIAMSADALGDVKEKVDNAGMDGYMSKPFDPDQLLSLLAEFKK